MLFPVMTSQNVLMLKMPLKTIIPVTNAGFSLDVLQMKLCPGVRHSFGLFDRIFPRVLSQ